MNVGKFLFKTDVVGFAFGVALLLTLTGCANHNVNHPAQGSVYEEPQPIYVAPATVYAMPNDYIYYSNYQVYYNSSRHQYAYLEVRIPVSSVKQISYDESTVFVKLTKEAVEQNPEHRQEAIVKLAGKCGASKHYAICSDPIALADFLTNRL